MCYFITQCGYSTLFVLFCTVLVWYSMQYFLLSYYVYVHVLHHVEDVANRYHYHIAAIVKLAALSFLYLFETSLKVVMIGEFYCGT